MAADDAAAAAVSGVLSRMPYSSLIMITVELQIYTIVLNSDKPRFELRGPLLNTTV